MTRDEIIAAACEIGWDEMGSNLYGAAFDGAMALNALERFATIIERKAAEAEREACAQIVERNAAACDNNAMLRDVLMSNAAAIRARGGT